MTRAPARHFEAWLERDDLTIEELVAAASEVLTAIAPHQTRYKVTERPDVRTIRYYVTQGLLPAPASYDGGRARYGGRHLVRLVALKRMQAEHHTLRRIATVLGAAGDAALREDITAALRRTDPGTPTSCAAGGAVAVHLELASGARIEVPAAVLGDPALRNRLADSMVSLAAWIRSSTPPVPTDPEGGPR